MGVIGCVKCVQFCNTGCKFTIFIQLSKKHVWLIISIIVPSPASMLSALIYSIYTAVAAVFLNLRQQWDKDAMAVLCRIGILLLTIGTTIDNGRAVFGNLLQTQAQTNTAFNTFVPWSCVINHQWLASFCILVPFSFIQKLEQTDRWKRLIPRIAVGLFCVLFVVGGSGFPMKQPNNSTSRPSVQMLTPYWKWNRPGTSQHRSSLYSHTSLGWSGQVLLWCISMVADMITYGTWYFLWQTFCAYPVKPYLEVSVRTMSVMAATFGNKWLLPLPLLPT